MPTIEKWLNNATQDTQANGEATVQNSLIYQESHKREPRIPTSSHFNESENSIAADSKGEEPLLRQDIYCTEIDHCNAMKGSKERNVDNSSQQSAQEANDTSGCWSIGTFSQEETEPVAHFGNFREKALFSQIANPRDEVDDYEGSSYSSILGDLSPRHTDNDMGDNLPTDNSRSLDYHHSLKNVDENDVDNGIVEFDNNFYPVQNIPSVFSVAEPSVTAPKAPVFVSSKAQTISLDSSNGKTKAEISKRKHNLAADEAKTKTKQIKLHDALCHHGSNGLAMKAKSLLDADQQAYEQWDTVIRGYMAQLGSVAYLGPIYPNTQLFRIIDIFDDNGLVHTVCIRVAEPPEELVWSHVSAAENQSQYDSQTAWSPREEDDMDHQIIFFSFCNTSLSQAMRSRFNQSRLVRIWPPWHEHLLQLEDGSVTTIKLVTQFITDAIY